MIQGRLVTNRQPGEARAANCNVNGNTQAKCRGTRVDGHAKAKEVQSVYACPVTRTEHVSLL